MGTGLGPSWFVPDFPALAARRDPFPDVERWQTTYVRYTQSEAAQTKGWDAELCRHNLQSLGLNDHPLLRQTNLPESINMRIIEAPAEFALPVKQDRRLLPCFKVRLEVQHRGAVSLPLALRAHVLSQQDKEQISAWMPPDESSSRDDKGQKAVTELKGTSVIRCTLETGATGELRTVGVGGRDGLLLPSSTSTAAANGSSCSSASGRSGIDRVVKTEPSYGLNGVPAGPVVGMGLGSGAVQRGAPMGLGAGGPHDGHGLDPFGMQDPGSSLAGGNGLMRDGAATGLLRDLSCPPVPPRDVNLGALFAPDRPDPVVTLASSGRMSGTGSSLAGLGVGQTGTGLLGGGGGVGVGGLRLNAAGEPRDAFDAAVEMLMQPSSVAQQQRRQNGLLDVNVGGSKLISEMQRQLQQQQQEERQQQQERASNTATHSSVGGQGGKLHTSCQDFEFINLEFLKPTRMNKVFMAFTASILDTDLLFVVFNVPTIGICRAEQREKACKKLHIDYRLLSHFDQGSDRPAAPAGPAASPSLMSIPGMGSEGSAAAGQGLGPGPGPGGQAHSPGSSSQLAGGLLSVVRLTQGKQASQQQQQQQAQVLSDVKFGQQQQQQQGPGGLAMGPQALKFPQLSDIKLQQLSDTDYPRMMSGVGLSHQHHHQQQQQQHLQQQQHQQQQRMADAGLSGALLSPGGGYGAPGLAGGAGMLGGGMSPGSGGPVGPGMGAVGGMGMPGGAMASGMMVGAGGMVGTGMAHSGMAGNGGLAANGGMPGPGGLGGRMMGSGLPFTLHNSSLGSDMGSPGADFFFGPPSAAARPGGGGGIANGGGMGGMSIGGMGGAGGRASMELGGVLGLNTHSRKRDQGPKEDDNYRFQPVQPELPPYQGFMGLTSSDVEMLLPAPHSRMAMRDFINEVYDGTGLHRKLTHMDMQALLSQAGFPMDSNREHDTISPQQWDEFCSQFRNIVNTLQQVAAVWNMEDPVVISGFDMDRAGTITALANEPAGTFICRFSMSQPGCLVLTCKVGTVHPRADPMGLIHAIIKIDDLHERRVDTWIRDYAGATHLLDVYRQKRVDKRKVFATNYTRLRGLEVGEPAPLGLGQGFM